MNYIKRINLDPHNANELVHLGFILKLVSMNTLFDTYDVYVLGGK